MKVLSQHEIGSASDVDSQAEGDQNIDQIKNLCPCILEQNLNYII